MNTPAGVFRRGLISILCSFETITNLTAPKTTRILTTQKNMFWNKFFFLQSYIQITPFIRIQVCFVTETVLKMDFYFFFQIKTKQIKNFAKNIFSFNKDAGLCL